LLGHAELFMKYEAMQPLAELQGGRMGRFTDVSDVFCASQEATYAFAERYWGELTTVFTDEYVHIGCDEVWDLGYCESCRERLKQGETRAGIFAEHVTRMHALLSERFNKRVMIWEDMAADFPELIDRLPKSVIRVVWKYLPVIDSTPSYFGHQKRENRFRQYEERGIEAWFAPREMDLRNVMTMTDFAERHAVGGAILTMWERKHELLLHDYPVMAFAGRYWSTASGSRHAQRLWQKVCEEEIGVEDRAVQQSLWAWAHRERWSESVGDPQSLFRGTMTAYARERFSTTQLLKTLLEPASSTQETGAAVLRSVHQQVALELLHHRLVAWCDRVQRYWDGSRQMTSPLLVSQLTGISQGYTELARSIESLAARWRPGQLGEATFSRLRSVPESWRAWAMPLLEEGAAPVRLCIRYCLPDYFGAQTVRWSVYQEAAQSWVELSQSVPKHHMPDPSDTPYFEKVLFFPETVAGEVPDVIRVRCETWGYGGIELAYVEVRSAAGTKTPQRIEAVRGRVEHEESLLTNDTHTCLLGETDSHKAFHDEAVASEVHSLVPVLG
ncbi:MAG: family 20 glycosylhydrolase, partial [Planctomycetota bacterium]